MANKRQKNALPLVGCPVFFTTEKIAENGEDWGGYLIGENRAAAGVFDGCGGSGAKTCPKYHNKTEAYIASRVVSRVFFKWISGGGREISELKEQIGQALTAWDAKYGETAQLRGMIKKRFPTTLAAFSAATQDKNSYVLDIFWAGDSRVYLLDEDGLAQLTEDDLGGIDAMQNLTDDGILTNVVSLSADFRIHRAQIVCKAPAFVFAATDGCFGYLSTPMEFEYLLLDSIANAGKSVDTLEQLLKETICKVAGDDVTMSGFLVGMKSLPDAAKLTKKRYEAVEAQYIRGLKEKTSEEKIALWNRYKDHYNRFLCRAD